MVAADRERVKVDANILADAADMAESPEMAEARYLAEDAMAMSQEMRQRRAARIAAAQAA
jgi:hypothetical protein